MKRIITLLIICFCFANSWGQSGSKELDTPKLFHIAGGGIETIDSLLLTADFTVLSLVSAELFDNWNVTELKSKVGKKSVLIVVAREDSDTKTKFVTSFYQNWITTHSEQRAYELAIEEFGQNAGIKHLLILNEK